MPTSIVDAGRSPGCLCVPATRDKNESSLVMSGHAVDSLGRAYSVRGSSLKITCYR